jgi:hypothetical protein
VRAFERRIGFEDTRNFLTFSAARGGFPFCAYVSRLYLPYSYEDPAIRWLEAATQEECDSQVEEADVLWSETEAIGESESPVTPSMLAAPLDRLLYLVIHEDCHDQYALPYGIEEALCNVITYRAMEAYADEKYATRPLEHTGIYRYAREGTEHAHVTAALYQKLSALYGRHGRGGMSERTLLRERGKIFRRAEHELAWPRGGMNNVWIANAITYARHHAFFERVFDTLGRDVTRTVAFFRKVDAMKPLASAVMAQHRVASEQSIDFVRANEAAILETVEQALASDPYVRSARNGRTASTKPEGLSSVTW